VSRVLLFVQTGDGRPKCFSSHGVNRSLYTDGWRLSESALTAQGAADRWWLVECENAEAGRRVIDGEPHNYVMDNGVYATEPWGRILASGGKP